MSDLATLLRDTAKAIRPHIEAAIDLRDIFAEYRQAVTDAGGDWMALKNLVKAHVEDEREGVGEDRRVAKIIERADFASAYADMLGYGKLNENNSFDAATNEATHDEHQHREERPAGDEADIGGGDHADRRRIHEPAGERGEQEGDRDPDPGGDEVAPTGHHGGSGRAAPAEGLVLPVADNRPTDDELQIPEYLVRRSAEAA